MQQRVVSLAPSVTSILCALGAHKQLVGVTRWCRDVAPVGSLPTLGDCWRTDAAKVAALKPDLVIGSVPYQAETDKSLPDCNLTFLAMNPLTLNDIFADIRLLGRPGWHVLPAVRDRRVYIVSDEALNTPGPPVADGLERLGRILHPEVFGPPEDAKVARVA